ncbi:MAG: NapC/NirT family cytochrome c [Coriobacteriia bacterium]|nr:NapC/NirT family cytochrome c [Coriobacteriia bacterium]
MISRLIEAFRNPVTRPRAIIWLGALLSFLFFFVALAVGATTSYWFCASVCHKVQDDAIAAYHNSAHAKVSCVSCHMPAGADPVTFLLHKVEALAELPPTVTNTFHLPLNPYSATALSAYTFPSTQCTQCHNLENREVTPSAGIVIDHEAHESAHITCTMCHNRVAHNEDGMPPVLIDPQTGKVSEGHYDFMTMTSCYRCHDMEDGAVATGECKACHTSDFDLVPESHEVADFVRRPHADAALAQHNEVLEAIEHYHLDGEPDAASKKEMVHALAEDHGGGHGGGHGPEGLPLFPPSAINECFTCHKRSFCFDCHGMDMPHPAQFLRPANVTDADGHPAISKDEEKAEKCVMCHGVEAETLFCNNCHHGAESNWNFDKTSDWTNIQHAVAVSTTGVGVCTSSCHVISFCEACHTMRNVIPASHSAADFVHPATPAQTIFGETPAKATAAHAVAAQNSTETCAVCHGEGGINAPFCLDCHGMEMPHPAQFRSLHSASDKATCANCHGFTEVCSSCHHIGATATTEWLPAHGAATNEYGSSTCVGKCHVQADCVACHQSNNVLPASHSAADFVKGGGHVTAFKADAANCLFCHEGDAATLPNSAFCKGCHGLDMPHPTDGGAQKFAHSTQLNDGTYARATCLNCHAQAFCDACHHPQAVADQPWLTYHAVVATGGNARDCYACHQETYCAFCHVRIARERRGGN